MKRVTRFFSGLFVLVALALSLVEGAWASTCASVDGMSGMASMTDSTMFLGMTNAAMPEMGDGHDCGQMEDGPEPAHDQHGSACPIQAGMTQGCAAAASLPASTITIATPSPEDAAVAQTIETSPHLFRVAAIFHPPKA